MTVKTSLGNISCSKQMLNIISLHLSKSAEGFIAENLSAIADEATKLADEIYFALSDNGYYDKVRR